MLESVPDFTGKLEGLVLKEIEVRANLSYMYEL